MKYYLKISLGVVKVFADRISNISEVGLLQVTYTTLPVPSDYGSLHNGEAKTPVAICFLKLDDSVASIWR